MLLASNGRVVASATYESKESCVKGIAAVQRLVADAAVIDEEPTGAPKAAKRAAPRRTTATIQ